MTAPITPDERAAMRETIATLDASWEADDPTRPLVTEHATLTLLAHVASAVPRLLDALDTAEREATLLREDVAEVRAALAEAQTKILRQRGRLASSRAKVKRQAAEVTRLLAERTAVHADDATCASCTHEYVADMEKRAEDAEAEIERLNAAFESVKACARESARAAETWEAQAHKALDRRDRAEAEVERLRAEIRRDLAEVTPPAPAPVWDEDTVRAVASILRDYPSGYAADRCPCGWVYTGLDGDLDQHTALHVLAVVREHLPVRPNRETTERALLSASGDWDMSPLDRSRMVAAQTHSVLDLWPGESRATVQAEALHDAADAEESLHSDYAAAERLRARADRLKQGEK